MNNDFCQKALNWLLLSQNLSSKQRLKCAHRSKDLPFCCKSGWISAKSHLKFHAKHCKKLLPLYQAIFILRAPSCVTCAAPVTLFCRKTERERREKEENRKHPARDELPSSRQGEHFALCFRLLAELSL